MQTMMKLLILPLLFLFVQGCPPTKQISSLVSFDKVVIQEPFPYPFNGIEVFNGVKMQKQGICSRSPPRNCSIPTTTCTCLPFSQYLLFNLIPTNETRQLSPQDATKAVASAQNITFTGSFRPSPLIPNILCAYDISNWMHSFSCLPKFCEDTAQPCLYSSHNCSCIAQPCSLYVAETLV